MSPRPLPVVALLLALPLLAEAQQPGARPSGPPGAPGLERREAMRERREAFRTMTPDERAAARERMRERLEALTPEQREALRARREARLAQLPPDARAWVEALLAERQRVRGAVEAGRLDRPSAAAQLRQWREANPRPRPPRGGRA